MSEYRFERLTDENLPDLVPLAKDAFGMNLSLNYFKKKFDTTWCGVKNVGYIAYDENNIAAAFYGVFPCFIKYENQIILAAQSGDTMTHSKQRGKGLFTKLAKLTYQLAKESGVKIVFGFPNENSYHGFVTKLDWIHKENMHLYKIKVFTLPIAKIVYKLNFLKTIYEAFLQTVFKNIMSSKKYFDNPNINGNAGIYRDENFFNYKNYSPKYLITIEEICVWLKIDGFLFVGDIEKVSSDKFHRVLKKLKRIACWIGASEILFQVSPNTNLDKLLSENHSFQKGAAIGYVSFDEKIDGSKLKLAFADSDTF